jgi:hypothetical protein
MEKLDKIFDIAPSEPPTLDVSPVVVSEVDGHEEDSDFHTARNNTLEIIEQCRASVNTCMRVAAETNEPRALEVLGNMLKISSEINKTLINLSKDRADAKTAKGTKSNQPVQQIGVQNNTQIACTSGDLNKILAERAAAKALVEKE